MRVLYAAAAFSLLVGAQSSCAQGPLPRDVMKFSESRDECDHFRGEIPDPTQTERMKEVVEAANKYCTGTDKNLSNLKEKYRNNPEVMKKLNAYEAQIEAPPLNKR